MAGKRRFGQDWLNMFIGLWLLLSPVFGVGAASQAASINAALVGMLVATVALFSLSRRNRWQQWTNIVLGAWLVAAPFLLGFSQIPSAVWNHVAVGASIIALAGWALLRMRRPGVVN